LISLPLSHPWIVLHSQFTRFQTLSFSFIILPDLLSSSFSFPNLTLSPPISLTLFPCRTLYFCLSVFFTFIFSLPFS
jgi:hypothetical protein